MQPHLHFTGFDGKRVHLGVTGSIAAYKSLDLLRMLTAAGIAVGVTLTRAAHQFVTPLSFSALGADPVNASLFDPGTPFVHLDPGQRADAFLVAPATANIIAKTATGICDDLLSTQLLAFRGTVLIAPAMNQRMWNAPATQENWKRLGERRIVRIDPAHGPMACGEEGSGRLAPLDEIALHTLKALSPQDLSGRRVLVSLGPTREHWDPARFWSNPSTGTMGGAIALAAWLRGALVTVVRGPVELWFPDPIAQVEVTTAREMHQACLSLWAETDIACMTAAVCDFAPVPHGPTKFKKASLGQKQLSIAFNRNKDILSEMGASKTAAQLLIGFAAETDDIEANARAKLAGKRLDFVVANQIGKAGAGFASLTNEVLVIDASGRAEQWPSLPKTQIAQRLWDRVATL
jgi:phosphopantothenoylcysteine decarboxylase / phosphopantothenate---cysteine ligase